MKKLAVKIILLATPVLICGLFVLCVDPFNYYHIFNFIPDSTKYENVYKINPVLWDTIKYARDPSPNIIIGDSRAQGIPVDYLNMKTGRQYKLLSATAAKINEISDYFWFANSYVKLENVYVVLNFNMYNFYAFANRVVGAEAAIRNPFLYIYDRNVVESSYLVIKSLYLDRIAVEFKPEMSKDQFWDWSLKNYSLQQYGKWKYPENGYKRLQEIGNYCKNNNINLVFIITPHHVDYQKKVSDYNLSKEQVRFKKDISMLATTYDFDYNSELTENKDNFRDPLHLKEVYVKKVIDEVITGNMQYGRLLKYP